MTARPTRMLARTTENRSASRGYGASSTIEIGGTLPEEHLFDLLVAAEEDGALLDGRLSEYDDEDFRLAAARGAPLRFARTQASAEEFVELEAFCLAHELTFRRFGDGGPSGQASIVFWAPHGKPPSRVPADARGRVYATLEELEAALTDGQTLAEVSARLRERFGVVPPLIIAASA